MKGWIFLKKQYKKFKLWKKKKNEKTIKWDIQPNAIYKNYKFIHRKHYVFSKDTEIFKDVC